MDLIRDTSKDVRILLPPRAKPITLPLPVQRYNSFLSLVQHTDLTATASKRIVDEADSRDLGWIQYNPREYLRYLKEGEDDFVIGALSGESCSLDASLALA